MTLAAESARPERFSILAFLKEELELGPGRLASMARIACSCAIVVAIAMLYQIPLPAYMAYIVFLISRDEVASTLLIGVVGALAATLAIGLSLVFYMLDASEPALRLPLMAFSAFIGMFLSRTMSLGPVAFLAGFVLVLSQTIIDEVPNLEALTRLVLWLWVVVFVPDAVTLLLNLLLGEYPALRARRKALSLLKALGAALRDQDTATLRQSQAEAIELVELRQRAGMLDRGLRDRSSIDTVLIETLAELLTLCILLPADMPSAAWLPLALACDDIATAFEADKAAAADTSYQPPEDVLRALSPEARPMVIAIAEALTRLRNGLVQRRTAVEPTIAHKAKALFLPDAFTNPDHVRFALKSTVAVMAAYIIYSGLDWPGISTAITTCFFVSLGSLGETVHKLTLRLSGAVIGGIIGGLCIVYVLPLMTDIGQLSLLIAGVSFACAWVATSSELLAYAGMQTAFAFFLGVLQGYAPATDLTVLRDRVVGIVLGNFLIALVFSTLWPVSAVDRARASLSIALRALKELMPGADQIKEGARLATMKAVSDAFHFVSIAAFELRMLPSKFCERENLSVDGLNRIAAGVFAVVDQQAYPGNAELAHMDAALSSQLEAYASQLDEERIYVSSGGPIDLQSSASEETPLSLRAAIEARRLLQTEIRNAAAIRI